MPSGRWCVTWRTKNWKTGESNPSTSLHRSRDQRQPVGLRWAGGWQKNRAPRETQGRRVKTCRSHVDRHRRQRLVLLHKYTTTPLLGEQLARTTTFCFAVVYNTQPRRSLVCPFHERDLPWARLFCSSLVCNQPDELAEFILGRDWQRVRAQSFARFLRRAAE